MLHTIQLDNCRMYISYLKNMKYRNKTNLLLVTFFVFFFFIDEKIWPPCIRVIVIRSPVLQTGSLYIITAVKPATIGR